MGVWDEGRGLGGGGKSGGETVRGSWGECGEDLRMEFVGSGGERGGGT